MAGKIFINYRREDTRADAARIRDRLVTVFGAANVFMDVDNLIAGQRFDQVLAKALAETDIFLAVMATRWAQILNERSTAGGRDYVREEIAQALERGVTVIPVMIERAPLPPEASLPNDLKELVLHQKHDVSHDRFGRDVDDLVQAIRAARKSKSSSSAVATPRRIAGWLSASTAAVVVAGAGLAYIYRVSGDPKEAPAPSVVKAASAPVKVVPAQPLNKEVLTLPKEADQSQPSSGTKRVTALPAGPAGLPATPQSPGYVSVLASRKTREEALLAFPNLQQQFSDLLRAASPDVREANLGDKGIWYRLVIGPPRSREAANELCRQLATRGFTGCFSIQY